MSLPSLSLPPLILSPRCLFFCSNPFCFYRPLYSCRHNRDIELIYYMLKDDTIEYNKRLLGLVVWNVNRDARSHYSSLLQLRCLLG